MRNKLLKSFVVVLIVGSLCVALSDGPSSALAIIGFISIGFSLALLVFGLSWRSGESVENVVLPEEEQLILKRVKAEEGQTAAIRALRESRPGISIVQAHTLIGTLH
ncbi:hypothetical protein CAPI_05615 [Corynebacterium capitovis DSM 44611]|nr:hypothetical protein CAPI_05615 [Corynebacterium capitovis DSM 44611]